MQATLSQESFRRKLAGLEDPEQSPNHPFSHKTQAIALAVVMARVFSDTLDRKTLWERIGTGLKSAAQKRPEGGESLVSAALDHVLADPGKAAVQEDLGGLLMTVEEQTDEWNRGWSAYLVRSAVIVTVLARAEWQKEKEARVGK